MIEQAPIFRQANGQHLGELSESAKDRINEINERYLYWSDVKYRAADTDLSPADLWQAAKYFRNMKDISVWHEFGFHFSLNNNIQRICQKFDMDFGGSWGAMKLFPTDKKNQELYLISSVMEEAISSSQMEGAATTRKVAKEMLRKNLTPRDRSQRMILNNYLTIQFITENKDLPLTKDLLLQIHALMTANTLDDDSMSGRLRNNDDIVVGNGITGEIVHCPPSYTILDDFVDDLCEFFNSKDSQTFIHPIIRALIVHFLIAYYHPFVDGNGRTARALFYWYMLKENYWLTQYLSISRIIYKTKAKYEKSFLYTENDSNDIGYFITYNLEVLSKAFDELRRYLKKKQAEQLRADRFLHIGDVSPQQAEIIRMFYDKADLTLQSKEIAARFGVSRVAAKGYLDSLTNKGFLNRIRLDGRTQGYIRSENFNELTSLNTGD